MSELEALIRATIHQNNGLEIDKTDGFLVVFTKAEDALAAALSLTRAIDEFAAAKNAALKMRTGLHYGTLIERRNTPEDVARGAKSIEVDGITKIIAARVAALAEPGQVLLTRDVFNMTREAAPTSSDNSAEVQWLAHGPYLLQGIHDPVDVFEAGIPGRAPLAPPRDQGKAQRAVLPQDELTLGWRPASGQAIPTAPDWKLLQKLGEGGYGEVWLAENAQGNKQVFKFCFNARRLRSLKREVFLLNLIQENLGRRDDIVDIVNWNVQEPPFYLALQHEPADNLATWFEDHRGSEPLPEETILTIVRQTAVALVAAHSIGVLHKDIKPSNLLVNETGPELRIQLIDFGVGLYAAAEQAQLAAELGLTFSNPNGATLRTSSVSGTRMYIAPELLEGKVPTVQADVFSVGVLLYQLLANDLQTGLKVGWEREIQCPHLRKLVADATDGNLQTRIQSAAGLVERIDSLKQEREAALIETERLHKEAETRDHIQQLERRRKTYAIALIVAVPLLLLSVALAAAAYQARLKAEQQTDLVNRSRDKLDGLVSFMLEDLGKELQKIRRLSVLNTVVSKTIEHFADESTATMSKQRLYNRSLGLFSISGLKNSQNEFPQAIATLRESANLARHLVNQYPNDIDITAHHLITEEGLIKSSALTDTQKFDALKPYVHIHEDLHSKHPDNLKISKGLARVYSVIARLSTSPTITQHYGQLSLNIVEGFAEKTAEGPRLLAATHDYMGYFTSDRETGTSFTRKAMSLYQALLTSEPTNMQYREALAKIRWHLASSTDPNSSTAATLMRDSLADYAALEAYDPTNLTWKLDSASAACSAAIMLYRQNNHEEAITLLSKACKVFDSNLKYNTTDQNLDMALSAKSNLAWYYLYSDRHSEYRTVLEQQLVSQRTYLSACLQCDKQGVRYLNDSANYALTFNQPTVLEEALALVKGKLDRIVDRAEFDKDISMSVNLLKSNWWAAASVQTWTCDPTTCTYSGLNIKNDTGDIYIISQYIKPQTEPVQRLFLGKKDSSLNMISAISGQGISINNSVVVPMAQIIKELGKSFEVSKFLQKYHELPAYTTPSSLPAISIPHDSGS